MNFGLVACIDLGIVPGINKALIALPSIFNTNVNMLFIHHYYLTTGRYQSENPESTAQQM
jgi:hypothetical protein